MLGSLEVPFLLSKELEQREDRLHAYYRAKVTELSGQRDAMKSKTEHYLKEVCFLYRIFISEIVILLNIHMPLRPATVVSSMPIKKMVTRRCAVLSMLQ